MSERLKFIIIAITSGLVLAAFPAAAATLSGRALVVLDGATITLLASDRTQHKVRLLGVIAPEGRQPFGNQSRQNLSTLIQQKQVTIVWEKRDSSGRIMGKLLFSPDVCVSPACLQNADAGYEQIAGGFAWHDKRVSDVQAREDRDKYAVAETQARAAKRGLWSEPNPVPPWEWRRPKAKAKDGAKRSTQ